MVFTRFSPSHQLEKFKTFFSKNNKNPAGKRMAFVGNAYDRPTALSQNKTDGKIHLNATPPTNADAIDALPLRQ